MEKCEKDKCCGNCCWFCFETTDGDGQCAEVDNEGYPMMMTHCGSNACEKYVSRQQMRHYMAVLLVQKRWMDDDMFIHYAPDGDEVSKAIDFAYKYMKVFGKL